MKINAAGLANAEFLDVILKKAEELLVSAKVKEAAILTVVQKKIEG